ncbi:MAG: GxxExxY protein [Anaerolineae bacterium]
MKAVQTIYDKLTYAVNGAAMAVHRELGPGYPEKVYHEALMIELAELGIPAQKEVVFTAEYRGRTVGEFRIDVFVDGAVVVELKAIEAINERHEQQVISYLTATGREVGLLLNFGVASLQFKRIFLPQSIQQSQAYQAKLKLWKPAWLAEKEKPV